MLNSCTDFDLRKQKLKLSSHYCEKHINTTLRCIQNHTKPPLLVISLILHTGKWLRDCLSRMSGKARLNSSVSCQWLKWVVNIAPSPEVHLFSCNTQFNSTLFSSISSERLHFLIPGPLSYIYF